MNFPNDTQHIAIIGRNGTGKTQAAAWHLGNRDIEKTRWVIIDYKRDALLNSLPGIQETTLDYVPHRKGVYIVHPLPDAPEEIDAYLWQIWEKENTGVFIDEGLMVGKSKAFAAILTQGRSKHIPVIVCTQRPVWLTRFVWSECRFFQVFPLNSETDYKSIEDFIPQKIRNMHAKLPDFHSIYYDVNRARTSILTPAPETSTIRELFMSKIGSRVSFV